MKMEIHPNSWNVKQLVRMITNKGILFDYPIQRLADQWSVEQKSDFIHTLAQDYPVPPIYFLKEDSMEEYESKGEKKKRKISTRQTLDGKQRLTTANSFINNEFALSPKTDSVFVENQEYDIAEHTFEELPEEVKDAIEAKMIATYNIDSSTATDEQIEDLFFRMNNGTTLTVQQKSKALMGKGWAIRFNELIEHPFFNETSAFSNTQLRSEGHIAAFIQSMMMKEKKDVTMSQGNIAQYSEELRYRNVDETPYEVLKDVLDLLYVTLGDKRIPFLKRVNVPMVLILATEFSDEIENNFGEWLSLFLNDLQKSISMQKDVIEKGFKVEGKPTDYDEFLGTGSTTAKKVYGRLDSMRNHYISFTQTKKL